MIKMPDRKLFSLFFLVILLGLKSLSYHPLAHNTDEDQLNCEVCEAVVINEYTPLLLTSKAKIPVVHHLTEIPLFKISEARPILSLNNYYYGRPPPSS